MFHEEAVEPGTLELLKELQTSSVLKDFYLAGGTSLSLQIGHRKSIDLDLFTQYDFEVNALLEYLEEHFRFALTFSAKNTLKGAIKNVNVDFIAHKYPFVKKPFAVNRIQLFSIEDIAAMKLNAIAGNGTRAKDFIDIYFILKKYSLQEILDFYKIKYSGRNRLHVLKSLNYYDEVVLNDWPEMITEKKLSFANVKKVISAHTIKYSKKYFND